MNCTRCDFPIEADARFCRNCGLPVSQGNPPSDPGNIVQADQKAMEGAQPVLPSSWRVQQSELRQTQNAPHPYSYQPTVAVSSNANRTPNAGALYISPAPPQRRKSRLAQVLLILLAVLLVLALLLAGGWFFLLRPYLHGLAQNEVDNVFASATNLINPIAVAVVAASNKPVIITENDANNFIGTNSSQSDPVQQAHLTITPEGLRMDFQTYGLTSTITGVPKVENGQIVMTNVTVQGPASIFMSPDELTSEVNADLQQVSAALQRPITALVLKDHEIQVTLG